jgi:hypothetical protein
MLSPFCKLDKPPVQDTGVKLVENAEQGDTTIIGSIAEVTSFGQADDCTRNMMKLL